ncbi:MAG: DUF4271 domain-containing protein [Bacteroides sp.]|nr:DUF4271 domain-containing protein [Bacteroides sp.]MCM1379052.1 DUF4271 domain-containing protein [Bacteroides sp.]MCM1445750.1 DUF4271 domain-containing protein [Prevotella sp.]
MARSAHTFFKQLFSTHREAIPGEKTLGERLVVVFGVIQTLVFEALLLYCACGADVMPPLASVAGLALLTMLLFAMQYCGYAVTGFTFSSGENTRLWLSAFMITQACAGLPMAATALGSLFYPRYITLFIVIGLIIYIAARIPLYIREFRIFYSSPASIFYFFLYLCTLEIVPFIGALAFTNFFSKLFC